MSAVTRLAALMLFRLTIVVWFVLALAACQREPYSRSNSGFSSLDKKVFYDFRSPDPATDSKLDAVTTRKILSAVFPAYLSAMRACKAGAEANQPGQIVPTIRGAAKGSFTAAGLQQTVYLIDVGECSRDPVFSTRRLAVFSAGTLTTNVEAPMGAGILRSYDLNGDGKNEVLLQDGHTGQGELIEIAKLVEFDKDKLVIVEDFGQIYDDTCDTDLPSKSIGASVVYHLPPPAGQKARFTVELYRAPCPAKGDPPQWSRVSGKY
ncbi:MAG: hypothetical protein LAN64_15535 [Acidobacteriia bacterium]|nr:hypothetical protein [Terriglobia bacterium]